ncbi:hypothetical protein CAPTEDRAFT_226325 [Capitella teleta]|uniref:Pyrrolo-quinoline quinone repeat domain-containing protein n=1 Tax=Capitella teleta TaxID=283909 RepID=R7UPZ1_CAPTE|nr:hypothetical protein CAPTEDRAFT_226325 [Capitella teleta]|eukprot:ELU08173.1 hypothetical protein CAPTEDRAFT_226325 [Capitella teleta]
MELSKEDILTESNARAGSSHIRKRKFEYRSTTKENNNSAETKRTRYDWEKDLTVEYGRNVFIAPILWKADANTDGTSLLVDKNQCIVGTKDGRLLIFNVDGGSLKKQWQFPDQVGAVFRDGDHLYAWCHPKYTVDQWKGSLYEIFDDEVRLMFDLVDFGDSVHHATMTDGCLALVDNHGSIVVLSVTGELLWHKECSEGHRQLFHADQSGLYVAFKKRVCKYSLDVGSLIWEFSLDGGRANVIHRGVVHGKYVYIEVSGKIRQFDAETGDAVKDFAPNRQKASGIAVGGGILLTGTCPTIVFNVEDGTEIARMNFYGRLDDAVSMICDDNRRLYTFWDSMYCVDLSELAITQAIAGRNRCPKVVTIPDDINVVHNQPPKLSAELPTSLLVECIELDGEVVGRTLMPGYDDSKNVALPFTWKELGKTYIVDELETCVLADCYRVKGNTKLVIDDVDVTSPKVKTCRNKSDSKETKKRRSSTFVTSLAMKLQPISLQSADQDI